VTNCYYCGDDDHLGRECPKLQAHQRRASAPQPAVYVPRGEPVTWCGTCDEDTRLLDMGHSMSRCPRCHPLRYQQLRQSRKCPLCNVTVLEWDHSPCETHARPGMPLPRNAVQGRPESSRLIPRLCYKSPLGMMVHAPDCACPPGSP
jgi:hypothetical protein